MSKNAGVFIAHVERVSQMRTVLRKLNLQHIELIWTVYCDLREKIPKMTEVLTPRNCASTRRSWWMQCESRTVLYYTGNVASDNYWNGELTGWRSSDKPVIWWSCDHKAEIIQCHVIVFNVIGGGLSSGGWQKYEETADRKFLMMERAHGTGKYSTR